VVIAIKFVELLKQHQRENSSFVTVCLLLTLLSKVLGGFEPSPGCDDDGYDGRL
jgi:hypothetical protein